MRVVFPPSTGDPVIVEPFTPLFDVSEVSNNVTRYPSDGHVLIIRDHREQDEENLKAEDFAEDPPRINQKYTPKAAKKHYAGRPRTPGGLAKMKKRRGKNKAARKSRSRNRKKT